MNTPFASYEPGDKQDKRRRKRRYRRVPMRLILPNIVTLLAICAGLTAMRMAMEQRWDWAIAAIVFAAILDALDGRLARFLKGTSRFGAELDSLADFVNFGVAPAIVLYAWILHEVRSLGWIAALIFAICAALRLARFNVMLDDPDKPAWQVNFFTGIPAPAGAITVLLPIYLEFLGLIPHWPEFAPAVMAYTIAIGLLMVSRVPSFSGKKIGARIRRDLVLPTFVMAVLIVALVVSYPFMMLTIGALLYLASLPFAMRSWYRQSRVKTSQTGKAKSSDHATDKPDD